MRNIFNRSGILLFMLFLCSPKSIAQIPPWSWAVGIGSENMDVLSSMTVDDNGNIYATGYYSDTVDFDPGTGTFNLVSKGNEDIFISKIDKNGDLVWAKSFGGISYDWGFSIKLDHNNNVVATGFFSDTVDFDPGIDSVFLNSAGNNDIFVVKLDSSGNFIWAKAMGGSTSDGGTSLAIDDADNIYITGSYFGTADFDPDTSAVYNLTTNGELEIFVSKLNSEGDFVWAKSIGGTEDDQGYAIALDHSANVYTTGYFEKPVDFDPGVDTFLLTAGNLPDAFILKLDSSGNFIWAKSFSGITDNDGYSIALDDSGNVYSTGYYNGTVDYDPDSILQYNLTSAGQYDIYISKLDSNGNFIWARSMGGTDDDQGFFLTLDDSANIYSTGIFRSTADLDPDASNSYNLTAAGGFDFYVSKIDSAGNFIWAEKAGGNNRDQCNVICFDESENIFLGGYFYSIELPLGSDTLVNSDSLFLNSDIFITRLGSIPTTLKNINTLNNILVYPNPAIHSITIEFPLLTKNAEISLIDITGKVYSIYHVANTKRFELTNLLLSSGLYFLKIQSQDFSETKKIIIGY